MNWFPPLQWLPKYKRIWLWDDALAGITLVTVLIPQVLDEKRSLE